MIKEIKYHLYDDNNAMESSLLRGILLFNCLENRRSRRDFIPRAVFSIIVEGDGEYSNAQILSIFNTRFKYGMTPGELSTIIQNLKKDGHLDANGSVIFKNGNGKEFFEAIDLETSNLFDRIIRKAELLLKSSFSNPEIVKENIRRALSVYFKLYGYAFFDLQESSWDESAGEAISRAMENISEREGCAFVAKQIEEQGSDNIYHVYIRGFRDPDIEFNKVDISLLGNVIAVSDESEPDYDFEELYDNNKDNMIGIYISRFKDRSALSEVEKKALYYGTKALLDANRD